MSKKPVKNEAYFLSEEFVAEAAGFPLDRNMLELVVALNRIPGIETNCSCGGHDGNKETPKGHFFVSLTIEQNSEGWAAIGLLASLFGVTQFEAKRKRRVRDFSASRFAVRWKYREGTAAQENAIHRAASILHARRAADIGVANVWNDESR